MNILTDDERDSIESSVLQSGGDYRDVCRAIESAALEKISKHDMTPIAHLTFWAVQRLVGGCDVEQDEGWEVAESGEIGADGKPAFPVYTEIQLIAASNNIAAELRQLLSDKDDEIGRLESIVRDYEAFKETTVAQAEASGKVIVVTHPSCS